MVLENKTWLTTEVRRHGGRSLQGGHSLRAVGIDLDSGRILHDVEVFRLESPPSLHVKNTSASPTPILEEGRVYVHFGAFGTAALNSQGEILWKSRHLRYAELYGPAGTPALGEDLLVVSCDGTDKQFVAALDKNNGKVRWKTFRQDGAMAYSTPLVIRSEGLQQVISTGGNQAVSYELGSGEKLWWIRYQGFSQVPRPLFAHGLVYLTNPAGEGPPMLYAVRPQGRGNVTDSHVVWTWQRGVPITPSPLIVGDEIYFVSDKGILTCLDARDGKEHWRARLGGKFLGLAGLRRWQDLFSQRGREDHRDPTGTSLRDAGGKPAGWTHPGLHRHCRPVDSDPKCHPPVSYRKDHSALARDYS